MSLLSHLLDLERQPHARRYTGEEYNLEGFRDWLASIGNPQTRSPWIHIAGTKGKGSTAAMTEAILRAAGCRTSLFTSPHLSHFGERFRFNGIPWTVQQFEQALEKLEPHIDRDRLNHIHEPHTLRTVFEVLTAMAFVESARNEVDAGILEVGLGGRLDCTNAIEQPVVCGITPIGLDHIMILGDTIEQIAAEKAGIVKPGRPVVVFKPIDERQERARRVIEQRAAGFSAPVFSPYAVEVIDRRTDGQVIKVNNEFWSVELFLSLRGLHQAQNFALASRLAEIFLWQQGKQLRPEHLVAAGRDVVWPGRLDVQAGPPALVVDGAHCPLSARALGRSLGQLADLAPLPLVLVWGMQRDKAHSEFLRDLIDCAPGDSIHQVVTYEVPGGRGEPGDNLAAKARAEGIAAIAAASAELAVRAAIELARAANGSILACGTLYTITEIKGAHESIIAKS